MRQLQWAFFHSILLWGAFASWAHANGPSAFVSKKATEARLTFTHYVELGAKQKPSLAEAKEQVEQQILHMFGPMERLSTMAAPKEDHRIQINENSIERRSGTTWMIPYSYQGTIVLEKGPNKIYRFPLPVNPDKIYARGFVGQTNRCTDPDFQAEEDFWYFWSPAEVAKDYAKCPLVEGEDFLWVDGKVDRGAAEAVTTYPEYHRLADSSGVIHLDLFYGMDDDTKGRDPYRSVDVNAEVYRKSAKYIRKLGIPLERWTKEQIGEIVKLGKKDKVPYVEQGELEFPSRNLKIRVRMFFGATGIDENSRPFHYFFRDSLENSSVMIYSGHSGLGAHLDLEAIAKLNHFRITPAKDRYQIYFFNACTSYTYYNASYFQRKRDGFRSEFIDAKGTKNLDILANGISTAFEVLHETDMVLLQAIYNYAERGTWTSYKRLAKAIDSDNLFTVNGDEDNPRSPVRE